MKKLLSKVFFVSDCARGAAFALTLLTLGNYLWFSLYHLLTLWNGKLYPRRLTEIFATLGTLTILYALALAVVSLIGLVKVLRRKRRFKALRHLIPAGVCFALGAVGFVLVFPPLYAIEILTCVTGDRLSWSFPSGGIPGLPPGCWAAVFFLSLLLILAGGLFLTAMFTTAEGKKFRSAFGAATLSVWGVFAVWYLFTLGLALHESRECAAVRRAVETRFGRSLTAAGLEKMYRSSGKVDAEFWPRQTKLRDALPAVKIEEKNDDGEVWTQEDAFWELYLPERPTAATLAWYENYCRVNRAALEAYESCFDREPPLPEKRFRRGNLASEELPGLNQSRIFALDFERSRLVYYLAVKNADAAWACYRRMGNVCAYLQKETFLIGSLVWLVVEQGRLNGVEKLLESRLLADARLNELDADLAALERDIPRVRRQAMYSDAVFAQDVIVGLEDGALDFSMSVYKPRNPPGAFAPYRWIFPDWWYHAALDKKTMLRNYLAPDFTQGKPQFENELLLMNNTLAPAFEPTGRKFYALTARARGMRALIRAEKYRRKHGSFPKTLSNLPEDPFTGKPLVYEVGKAEITETVWKKTVARGGCERRTADVVQIRSDPETTLRLELRRPENAEDPTRAMIRY